MQEYFTKQIIMHFLVLQTNKQNKNLHASGAWSSKENPNLMEFTSAFFWGCPNHTEFAALHAA